ncbi:GGDEF domain-containing protein [Janthinobacterium sp. 17J80-10]|uniref:GGDEF domain-containing protein n=1 Tax=Janthinobacterium sp. 17J80-10 TaxID=2497863 RepID=UPI0013E8BA0E|nr:GGDEF domain-containing protein [Janthinobacterium sp. 17J80-10]
MLNLLHPPTLGVLVAVLLTTLSTLMLFVLKTRTTYSGFGNWVTGFFLLAGCFLVSILRLYLPEAPTILLSNGLGIASLGFFYDGIAGFYLQKKPRPDSLNWGLGALVIAAQAVNLYQGGDVNTRVIWFNAFQFFVAARIFLGFSRYAHGRQRSSTLFMLAAFLGIGVTAIWRIVAMLNAPSMADLIRDDIGYRVLILVSAMLVVILAFCFLLLTHTRIEEALDEARAKAEHAARIDSLTGMWNRRHFELEALREIDRAKRYGLPVSLVMFDIDHFKLVNDRFGHLAGDDVLKQIAVIVQDSLRTSDLACRWGGEEFAILMPVALADAVTVAEKLRFAIAQHDFAEVGKLSISGGCAQLGRGEDLTGWSRRADAALYRAKGAGRNRVENDVPGAVANELMLAH